MRSRHGLRAAGRQAAADGTAPESAPVRKVHCLHGIATAGAATARCSELERCRSGCQAGRRSDEGDGRVPARPGRQVDARDAESFGRAGPTRACRAPFRVLCVGSVPASTLCMPCRLAVVSERRSPNPQSTNGSFCTGGFATAVSHSAFLAPGLVARVPLVANPSVAKQVSGLIPATASARKKEA